MNRCVNIDWLEVYCLEPQLLDGTPVIDKEFLERLDYIVEKRAYGTPTYEEMLTVAFLGSYREPFAEIRRKPRVSSDGGSFLHPASCHIRLTNRFCYDENPIILLCDFLLTCGYRFQSIKRVDIALDFNYFDDGEDPRYVMRDYLTEKLAKINQSRLSAHGKDSWDCRSWNSLSWGSPTSNIVTRFYNKTLELKENKMKTYIQDCWKQCGLDLTKDVWRVEFAIKAGQKGFKKIKTQEFYKMKLEFFDSRSKLLFLHHILCTKYFHFKYKEFCPDGSPKRKDRCRDKVLFNIKDKELTYTPAQQLGGKDPTRSDRVLMRKLYRIANDDSKEPYIQDSARLLADHIQFKLSGYIIC